MIEFSLPWQIISPLGTYDRIMDSDDGTAPFWRPVAEECDAGADLRVNDQDLPQTDGLEIHPHFRSGYRIRLTLQPFDGGKVATGSVRRDMWEELNSHLEAIRNADGRIQWSPSDEDDRILDGVRLTAAPKPTGALEKKVAFEIASRFPYYVALTQTNPDIPDIVTNDGNAAFSPVLKVHGPITSGFTVSSATDLDDEGNAKQLVYDTSLPGAPTIASGHYIEFDFFRCTATLDGDVNFTPQAGIDGTMSDFFKILPGDNDLGFDGDGTADILLNDAWV